MRIVQRIGRHSWRVLRDDERAALLAERERYREALARIAGPPDSPSLTYDGKIAAKALRREPATPEQIAARARRDYEHYLRGVFS